MEKGCGIALSPAAPVSGGVPALSDGSDPQTPESGMTAAARASSSERSTSFARAPQKAAYSTTCFATKICASWMIASVIIS